MAKKKDLEVVKENVPTNLEELKALAKTMSAYMNAQYNQAVSYVPDAETRESVQVSRWLNLPQAFQDAVELPGLPFGNITCVYGKPDTGKTTILMMGIKACQDQGILPILILTEHKFSYDRLETFMGADPEAMLVLTADNIEQGYSYLERILRDAAGGKVVVENDKGDDVEVDISKHGCFVFWDSIGNTASETTLEGDVADHGKDMGKTAKAIKNLTKRTNQLLNRVRQKVGVLFLNQSYTSIPTFGPPVETPYGGEGIPYSAVFVLRTRRKGDLKMTLNSKEAVIGTETILQVMKNHITHKKTNTVVYVVGTGIISPTKEALDEYKAFIKKLE